MAESTRFVSSPPRRASTSVIARAPSATPVMNRAGSLDRSVPTVTFPCWLSSAMVMDTSTLDRSVSAPFFDT